MGRTNFKTLCSHETDEQSLPFGYRIVTDPGASWCAAARRVSVLRLERFVRGDWTSVASADYLKWPPRRGTYRGRPHTYHSEQTAVAFLQGYAAQHANRSGAH